MAKDCARLKLTQVVILFSLICNKKGSRSKWARHLKNEIETLRRKISSKMNTLSNKSSPVIRGSPVKMRNLRPITGSLLNCSTTKTRGLESTMPRDDDDNDDNSNMENQAVEKTSMTKYLVEQSIGSSSNMD
jgi:hypothetical protein